MAGNVALPVKFVLVRHLARVLVRLSAASCEARLRDIEEKFDIEVARIVEGCTDSFEEDPSKKQEWEVRKASYIERLWNEPPETLLVSIADKLYNARAILEEYRQIGAEVWTRFKRGRKHLWYFGELIKVYDNPDRLSQKALGRFRESAPTARVSWSSVPRRPLSTPLQK